MSRTPPRWADLAREQAAEREAEGRGDFSAGRPAGEVLATDYAGPDDALTRAVDRRDDGPVWAARHRESAARAGYDLPLVLIGGVAWTANPADAAGYVPTFLGRVVECPGCRDKPLRRGELCIICHATAAVPEHLAMQDRGRGAKWDGSRDGLDGGKGRKRRMA